MPDQAPPTPPSTPQQAPLESRFQNYLTLRQHIRDQFLVEATSRTSPFLSFEVNPALTQTAAHIIGQRAIRYLPEGDITQADLIQALLSAQDELADRELWFAATLPKPADRETLATAISLTISPETARAAVQEEALFAQASLDELPEKDTAISQIQEELQSTGIDPKKSRTLAAQLNQNLETWSLRNRTAAPLPVIQVYVRRTVGRSIENTQALSDRLSQQDGLSKRSQAIAHNADKGLSLIKRGIKITQRFPAAPAISKVGKVLKLTDILSHPLEYTRRAITFPFRYVGRQVARPVVTFVKQTTRKAAIWTLRQTAALLTKIGLGGLVRFTEEAALAATGFGLPLAIAQELFFMGAGKLLHTNSKLRQDWRNVFRGIISREENAITTTGRFLGTGIDTLNTTAFGVTGTVAGAALFGTAGALIGSVVPVVGTIIGAIIGGVAGGVLGGGVGADFGYKLRKRTQRLLTTLGIFLKVLPHLISTVLGFLGGAFLGFLGGAFLGFLIGGPLGALLGGILGGALGGLAGAYIGFHLPQIITGIQNTIANVISGAKTFVTNISSSLTGVAQTLGSGTGPIAQAIQGIGSLVKGGISTVTQGFNTLTGTVQGGITGAAAKTEFVFGEVLTAQPAAGITYTPVFTIIAALVFSLITYTVLTASYFVPPTEVTPFYDDPSRFIKIKKEACVEGYGCTRNQMNLKNPTEAGPYTITYTIEVEATDRTLTAVTISDEYSTFGRYNPPSISPREWSGGIVIQKGRPWRTTLTLNIPNSKAWDDSLLVNSVKVTATVEGFTEQVTKAKSVTLIFGNPPFCPPNGDPIDSPYGISSRYLDPGRSPAHTGIDLTKGPGQPIYSTFPCQAIVVYAGPDPLGVSSGFGYYVALQSGTWYTFSAHMPGEPPVSVGDIVGGGTVIGFMDNTGNSTGTHLHYEIRDGTLGEVVPSDNYQPPLAVDPCEYGLSGC